MNKRAVNGHNGNNISKKLNKKLSKLFYCKTEDADFYFVYLFHAHMGAPQWRSVKNREGRTTITMSGCNKKNKDEKIKNSTIVEN